MKFINVISVSDGNEKDLECNCGLITKKDNCCYITIVNECSGNSRNQLLIEEYWNLVDVGDEHCRLSGRTW